MLFVLGALAAWAGILLAALESPHVRDQTRIERSSTALVAVTAVTAATGALLNWIT
jgi:hypothetical protein